MNEQSTNDEISRRKFFVKLSLGIAGLSAAVAAIPVVSALIAPLLEGNNEAWRTVGKLNDFGLAPLI